MKSHQHPRTRKWDEREREPFRLRRPRPFFSLVSADFLGKRRRSRAPGPAPAALLRARVSAPPPLLRRPSPHPALARALSMSGGPDVKAGVGILSIRVERVHLRRWPAAPPRQQPPPTPRLTAAVNFDDPAALEPDVLELPGDHPVARRDVRGRAEAWHGVALRAIGDVLHLELELEPGGGIVARASVPVAAFLEDAFLRGDSGGAERTFELHPHLAEEEEEEAAPEDDTVTSEDPSEARSSRRDADSRFTSAATSSRRCRVASASTSPAPRASSSTPPRGPSRAPSSPAA